MRCLGAVIRRGVSMAMAAVLLVAAGTQPAAAGTPTTGEAGDAERPVAIVAVRDLTWRTAPPVLDGYAKANLSMRNAKPKSAAEDTYLTLGKGNRSASLGEAGVGRVEPVVDNGLRLVDWPRLMDRDAGLHFGGPLGSVADSLRRSGRRWVLASDDPAAAAVAATVDGIVPRAYPGTLDGVRSALHAQPDAMIVAVPRSRLPQILQALDVTCTLVVSASTPGGNGHLGVLATSSRCGLGSAGLASSSTHHSHLATLPDVTATFLALTVASGPVSLGGAAVTPTVAVDRHELVARDHRAWTADRARPGFVWLFVILHALGAWATIRMPRARSAICASLLAVPAAGFLIMLAPWWRAGPWAGLLVGGALAAGIAFGGTLLIRRDARLGVGVMAAFTAAVVGVDALFGSPLQIDAPFGNSPVGAGRFFGVGNIGSGFLVAGLLVAGGLALERWGRSGIRWVVVAFTVGTVVGGAPQFGADVGGVLYAVPAYGVLVLKVLRPRLTVRHVAALACATVVAIGLFAAVDLVHDAGSQTHLAKGVAGQGLPEEVVRKAILAVRTVVMPMAALVVIGATVLFTGRNSPGRRANSRPMSTALLTAALLGSLLNDSGAIVAAAVFAVAWPAGMALDRSRQPDLQIAST